MGLHPHTANVNILLQNSEPNGVPDEYRNTSVSIRYKIWLI
jgi:hypothetical protein